MGYTLKKNSKYIDIVLYICIGGLILYLLYLCRKKNIYEKFESIQTAYFPNDNNVEFKIDMDATTNTQKHLYFQRGTQNEVLFRKICTFLINTGLIKNNIIDLGAWIGDNSVPWARNIQGTVYAIDPSSENCKFIQQVSQLNNVSNVKVIQTGVSDKNETISTNEDLTHCSFMEGGTTQINAVTLDYLMNTNEITNIGFIHLDVEGMEHKVVNGAQNLIERYRPLVVFEQHINSDDYRGLSKFFIDRNYKVFLIDEQTGARTDCRNLLALPIETITDSLLVNIENAAGKKCLEEVVVATSTV
jgi:FkbM family methyltransferase